MPLIFKPEGRTWGKTEHLKDVSVVDHNQALERAWEYRTVSPDTGAFWDEMSWWHKLGAWDQETFTNWMAGPMAGPDTRLVAAMSPAQAALMHLKAEQQGIDILKDRWEFYKFIKRHNFAAPGV